jgi:uncharacterized protein YukE
MASHDFAVDLKALIDVATKASESVQAMKDNDVSDFVPSQGDVGSDVLWQAVDEFQDRWERGINDLVRDIEEVAGRLGKVAMTYADFDAAAKEHFTPVVAGMSGLRVLPDA